jgi:prolyl-tRNA editing enzyme YbaK/EbsC (Cys-tRNA(Pro) deacylase)
MSLLERASVRRVSEALAAAGCETQVIELETTARTARDAAQSLGCELGAIVKSLLFDVAGQPVMALVAGDRQCDTKLLPAALGLEGKAKRADADAVRRATGFSIGGVAPLAHTEPIPIAFDASLRRFATVFAAAGHPHCVFGIAPEALIEVSGGIESAEIGKAFC